MKVISFIFFLFFFVFYVSAQSAVDFCQNIPPGMYCNSDLSGYYWCLDQESSSILQPCPGGTVCLCFHGPDCTRVPTVGNGSPCGFATTVPSYASSFTATQTVLVHEQLPACVENSTIQRTVYVDGESERIDSTIFGYISCTSQSSITHTQEYYTLNSNGTVTKHVYSVDDNSCSGFLIDGPLPNVGVPSGYEYFGSDTVNGQSVDVYYIMSGLIFPSELSGFTNYIYVIPSSPVVPVKEVRVDYAFRINTQTNTTWDSFTSGTPSVSFTLPTACS